MLFEIRPHEGAGPLRFGMKKDAVRLAMGAIPSYFKRTPDSISETDAFEQEGVYVEYDERDECEAIEIAAPSVAVVKGRNLVGVPFLELLDWFRTVDPETQVDDAGLTSTSLGIGLYAPSAGKAPAEPVESAIVFRSGYYG